MTLRIGLLLGLATLLAGCDRKPAPPAEGSAPATRATPADAARAGEGAMCAEHGVLEVVCTRCNPKLAPVFKAKGDWCAEHDLPESICPVCHPERGGRPAAQVDPESEPPADGTLVVFRSREVAEQAGIETVRVVAGEQRAEITATAILRADAASSSRINARIGGVIREVRGDVGTVIEQGGVLALVESAELAAIRSRLTAARDRLRTADAALERERSLFDQGIAAAREVDAARSEMEAARAEVAAGTATLEMIGATTAEARLLSIRSPIAGTVTERHVSAGALVSEGDPLFEVVDVTRLWAEIDIPEREAVAVRLGQPAVIVVDGVAGEITGAVDALSPVIDPATRTLRARVRLDNSAGRWRANMYARARILGAPSSALLVPREAVQEARGAQLVFVRRSVDRFETRRVRTNPAGGDLLAVTSGLQSGDEVVTVGSFLLKTETLKESIGAGCCDVEPPKR